MCPQTLKRIVGAALLSVAAITATVFACGWSGTPNSVRFHGYLNEREMGRLPPLPTLATGINTIRVAWELDSGCCDGSSLPEEPAEGADDVWDRAKRAEEEGKLGEVRTLLKEYLERTEIRRTVASPAEPQQRRNSATDRLDALSALDRGSNTSRVEAYLKARRSLDNNSFGEIVEALNQVGPDVNLKDNVAYLRAAQLYHEEKFEKAAESFSALARQYPRSEKREAALFMAAVATMKTSAAFSGTTGDEAHLHEGERAGPLHPVEIDKQWHSALAGFSRLMTQYPRGRYYDDARGWMAYLLLRRGDRAGALIEYYRMLASGESRNTKIEATFSLEFVRHHATEQELSRVEKTIAAEPEVALAYAYHNIYNYAIDPGEGYPDYEPVNDANGNYDHEATSRKRDSVVEEWESDREETKQRLLARIITFSRRLMERYPKLSIGGAFALRTAQASFELGRNEDSAGFARRALKSGLSAEEQKQALWTFGVAEHRLKHFDSARDSFNALLRDFPSSDLTEGARAHLAMIAEDAGDIENALEQYIALDYSVDAAYVVDVLMTPEQLVGYIERHPDSPQSNELTYALAVRYLRANRWDEARTTLAKVRTEASGASNSWDTCVRNRSQCAEPKEGDYNDQDQRIITTRLIMRDIQTANDLERLQRLADQADGDEAKAEAMYQLASYQYDATTLLFYNPIAWTGGRYWNLSHLAAQNNYRSTTEPQTLFAYMQEHDTPARALKIYLEIADQFPNTRAARDSLYTAAVCHERLAHYNDYWRQMYNAGLHAGSRFVSYKDVKAAYPSYQLPRGTFGWEPSTRTVNDGPGWAPPPKPIPRPSRMARVKILLETYITPILLFWNETGRQGLSLLTMLIAMAFTARIATQNRKSLRPKLLRVRTRNAQLEKTEPPASEMFWTNPRDELFDRVKRAVRKLLFEFWELAQDANSRPVLLRNIFSHSFLVVLILSLLWTLHYG